MLNERSILDQLDSAATAFEFPGLNGLYDFYARGYLRAFRSANDWLLTLELFCFGTASHQFETILFAFGSDVKRGPLQPFDTSRCPVQTIQAAPFCNPSGCSIADPLAFTVAVCGEVRTFAPQRVEYERLGLDAGTAKGKLGAIARYLAHSLGDSIFSEDARILRDLKAASDMRCLFRSSLWQHPDVCGGELPSQTAFFRGLARGLAENQEALIPDVAYPNSRWSDWPDIDELICSPF